MRVLVIKIHLNHFKHNKSSNISNGARRDKWHYCGKIPFRITSAVVLFWWNVAVRDCTCFSHIYFYVHSLILCTFSYQNVNDKNLFLQKALFALYLSHKTTVSSSSLIWWNCSTSNFAIFMSQMPLSVHKMASHTTGCWCFLQAILHILD